MIFSSTLTTCKNSSFILLLSMVLLYNISKNKNQEKTVKKKRIRNALRLKTRLDGECPVNIFHQLVTLLEQGRGTMMELSCRCNGQVEILLQIHIKGCLHLTQP